MRSILMSVLLITGLVGTSAAQAGEKFGFDKSHSSILFFVDHFGFAESSGEFLAYDGELDFDRKDPTKSSAHIRIDVNSINTDVPKLDEHLKSEDFFHSTQFPSIEFKSTKFKKAGKNKFKMMGDLTMRGVTKPVTLDVTLNKAADNFFTKKPALGFRLDGVIKRSEFGVSAYVPNVGDNVKIRIDTEMHAK